MPPRQRVPAAAGPIPPLLLLLAAAAAIALLTTAAHAFLLPPPGSTQQTWPHQAASRRTQRTQRARPPTFTIALSSAAAAATVDPGEEAPRRVYKTRFDPEKGARLASFSFAVYGNPSGSRFFRSKDGSDIGFHDDEVRYLFVLESF